MKNKFYKIAVLLLTATVMQSCFVAKEYRRPELKKENLYRNEINSNDTLSFANLAWNTVFTDPVLQGYIKKGLDNNLDIKIAIQNIVAAQAIMKQGKAGYFRTLSVGADWTHQELSRNSQFGALLQDRSTNQYQLTGNFSWEADIWGENKK